MPTKTKLSIIESDYSIHHKMNRIREQERFKNENGTKFSTLTNRELQITRLIVNDFNNPEIASELYISRKTVEQHRKNINRKLAVRSIPQLFQYALAFDLI